MAILGGAIIPLLQGALADTYGLKGSFLLPIICYLYIAYFGYFCYRKRIDAGGDVPLTSGH